MGQEFMYRNRCFVYCFCFVCEITRESETCNLMEACSRVPIAHFVDRNFLIALIGRVVNDTYKKYRR